MSEELNYQLPGDLAEAGRTVAALAGRGFSILAGSDAPNPGTAHGATLHTELELLVHAGLTPTQALASATSVPADRFRLSDRGRIAPGLRADLLLVDGDPTRDITATKRIEAVWRSGIRLDRLARQKTVERELAASRVPAPAPPLGLVSGFDDSELRSNFGSGWVVSTDSLRGGSSSASMTLVKGGAASTAGSLQVSGEVQPGLPYAWAGALFNPGAKPFRPADLSPARGFSFFARGDGQQYRVMVFSKRKGTMPTIHHFKAGAQWERHQLTFREHFEGMDGSDVTAIAFVAGPAPAKFRFQLDELTLPTPPPPGTVK